MIHTKFPNLFETYRPEEMNFLLEDVNSILMNEILEDFHSVEAFLDKNSTLNTFSHEVGIILQKNISIEANWINFVTPSEIDNNFGWHSDEKYPGTHVGIYWLIGENDKGGDLLLQNPEFSEDVIVVPYSQGQLTIFPKNIIHKVEHYSGMIPRVSLNFTFSY